MAGDITAEILAAEKRRCEAMLANDGTALEPLLDERLQFAHATGAVDDKAAYLAKIAGGRIVYASIDWSEDTVIPLGDEAALLTGRMTNSVKVEGTEKQLRNRVMTAWTKTDGAWKLVAFQSTPLND